MKYDFDTIIPRRGTNSYKWEDFPLRGKKVFLNIRRRRWLLKKHNEYISRNWRMVAEGTRMTQDFASFLKELY